MWAGVVENGTSDGGREADAGVRMGVGDAPCSSGGGERVEPRRVISQGHAHRP
jgi:hypothetical protein